MEPQNLTDSDNRIFEYHYFSPKKNVTIRYGVTKGPGKAILLLLHGRAEFIEKYQQIARDLQKKGYQVISPDWRGQGLSSRKLDNRHKGHIDRFDDYLEDLDALWLRVMENQDLPVYILAHSMGGHIALRFMSLYPSRIQRAVLVSPMIEIFFPAKIEPLIKFLSDRFSRTSFAKKYTLGSKNYSLKNATFNGNDLCHDPEKYWILHNEIKKNPDLALGGVTWGWLNAAFESISILRKDEVIDKIRTPLLLVSAQKDRVVSSKAQEALSKRLPSATFFSIKGAFHEILFETQGITRQFWDAFDRFMGE